MKDRKRLERTFGGFFNKYPYYPLHHSSLGCYYCGDTKQCVDHCPPLRAIELMTIDEWSKNGFELITLPSCNDCNAILGSAPLYTRLDRAERIKTVLESRYEHQPILWSDDELAEMSDMFASGIRARRDKRDRLLDRMRHVQWRCINPE